MSLQVYADAACKKPIDVIEWNASLIITLVTGEKETLKNTAQAGETAKAIVYVRNESDHRFMITILSFPDKRVNLQIDNALLLPKVPTKLTVSFEVPLEITPEDVIKSGKIKIEGYYIYRG